MSLSRIIGAKSVFGALFFARPLPTAQTVLGLLAQEEYIKKLIPSRVSVTGSGIVPEMIYFQNRKGGATLIKKGYLVHDGI